MQERREVPLLRVRRLGDLDAALACEHLGIDEVHPRAQAVFEQTSRECSREESRFLPGEVALVSERCLADRAVSQLRMQQTQPAGQVHVGPYFGQFRRVDRGHVHGVGDLPLQQEIGDELRRLDRDVFLRLHRRCAEVGRQDDIRRLRERVVGGDGFGAKDIHPGPGDRPGREGVRQRLLINDAAASHVQDPRRLLHRAPVRRR